MRNEPCFPSLFYGQKLNAIGIPLLFGVFLFLRFPTAAPFFLMLLAGIFLVFAVKGKEEKRAIFLCIVLGLSLSFLLMGGLEIQKSREEAYLGARGEGTGYVVKAEKENFDLYLEKFDGISLGKKVRVRGANSLRQGDRICLTVTLSDLYSADGREEGVVFSGKDCEKVRKTGETFFLSSVGKIRARLSRAFGKGETGSFLSAILLGERDDLSPAVKSAFEKTASSHILAISGFHISLCIGFFLALARAVLLPRRVMRLLLYPLTGVLFFLAGCGVSVFRACVMTLFSVTAFLLRRRSDSVTSLTFAACLLVFQNPFALESASFLFSYVSTFALVTAAVPLSDMGEKAVLSRWRKRKWWHGLILSLEASLAVSSSIFVFTLPLQLLLFGAVQPYFPLYAILLIPCFSLCLIFALLAALIALLPLSLPHLFRGVLLPPRLFLFLVKSLADASPALSDPGPYTAFCAYFFLFALILLFLKKEKLSRIYLLHLSGLVILVFSALIT